MSPSIYTRLIAFLLVISTWRFGCAVEPDEQGAQGKKHESQTRTTQIFDGKSLKNWDVIDKNDFEKHGAVTVQDGTIVLKRGKPATGISYKGKFPRTNYEVSLEGKRIEGSDFFCGMTFPVGESYCTLILGGWGGGVTGLSNIDGEAAVENETTDYVDFEQNRWYRIRLRVTGKEIQAWVDKEQIIDVDTKDRKFSIWWEQEPVRPFGVANWYTTSALRNIRLKAVKPQ